MCFSLNVSRGVLERCRWLFFLVRGIALRIGLTVVVFWNKGGEELTLGELGL